MPNPKDFEDKSSFMGACIREVYKEEGKPHKQAVAQCLSMWRGRDKKACAFDKKVASASKSLESISEQLLEKGEEKAATSVLRLSEDIKSLSEE